MTSTETKCVRVPTTPEPPKSPPHKLRVTNHVDATSCGHHRETHKAEEPTGCDGNHLYPTLTSYSINIENLNSEHDHIHYDCPDCVVTRRYHCIDPDCTGCPANHH